MKTENYNRDIRKYMDNLYVSLNNTLKIAGYKNINLSNIIFVSIYNTKEIPQMNVLLGMIYMTGYEDLYLKLKRKEKNKTITKEEIKLLEILEAITSFEELIKLPVKSPIIMNKMIDSMIEFNRANVFKKIIRFKSIDEEKNERLSKVNTVYYQDKENYDIKVTLDFIVEKINIGIKNQEKEKVIMDAANFIKQLININDKDGLNILSKLSKNNEENSNLRVYEIAELLEDYINKEKVTKKLKS